MVKKKGHHQSCQLIFHLWKYLQCALALCSWSVKLGLCAVSNSSTRWLLCVIYFTCYLVNKQVLQAQASPCCGHVMHSRGTHALQQVTPDGFQNYKILIYYENRSTLNIQLKCNITALMICSTTSGLACLSTDYRQYCVHIPSCSRVF